MQLVQSMVQVFYVFLPIAAIALFKYLAIQAYKNEESSPKSWMARTGSKLANGRSVIFSLLLNGIILVYSFFLFILGLYFYVLILFAGPEWLSHVPAIVPVSGIVFIPLIIAGILYITMTTRGLSWWDAFRASYRFDSFYGKAERLTPFIEKYVDEAQEGMDDPHRAFLTLQRLFNHRFQLGEVARELILDMDPSLYHDLETSLLEEPSTHRKSTLLFFVGAISLLITFAAEILYLAGFTYSIASLLYFLFDFSLMLTTGLSLLGIIVINLELPEYKPDEYQDAKSEVKETIADSVDSS